MQLPFQTPVYQDTLTLARNLTAIHEQETSFAFNKSWSSEQQCYTHALRIPSWQKPIFEYMVTEAIFQELVQLVDEREPHAGNHYHIGEYFTPMLRGHKLRLLLSS